MALSVRRAVLGAVAATVVTGCAYYNGLYNANRLADEARRAEREGRQAEARTLWSRAATKAESVSVRFPGSKWRDDALLLQGQALLRIDQCTRAVDPLQLAADSSPDRQLRNQARIDLGRCRLFMREAAAAERALTGVLLDGDSAASEQAFYWRGQALLDLGRPEAALQDLERTSHPDAAFLRALALKRLGRSDGAVEVLEARVSGAYQESLWLAALDSLGGAAPAVASGLARELAAAEGLSSGQRARLLLGDGERWIAAGDTATAADRFRAARDAAPDSTEGRTAGAWLAVFGVRAAGDLSSIDSLHAALREAVQRGGRAVQVGGRVAAVLRRTDSLLRQPAADELHLFMMAEDLRDSVRAARLAGRLFMEIARRYPESVLTPKALLAAALLRVPESDSLVRVLESRYEGSVYAQALRGEAGERYRIVEDSLRSLLAPRRGRVP